ncbi:PREDICTED: uncharacterized protein LOC105455135 isoform X1 [Wasmannia auropunctata]|uniref:uncharacterized protein LOC105455135 isoform X1 n=1 Tax=Wasmannia auropunctata TaxID=64793 RepID=UPI0005EE4C13|nr:PREDICTED: uncharacterized protein LOC105455135 isoform X1 [Wasmannia auropunctata]
MEISKSLEEEIRSVQQKLQGAILNHKIYVDRLKDDPNNPDILVQIKKIQVHIVSLGKCQKQVVQQLRKEVNAFMADNANGSKVSINLQSLLGRLGLNNNNHITNNNETKHEAANGFETKPSKEDYEEVVRNGDVHHSRPQDNDCAKLRPSSVETVSGEDDVVEVSLDENSDDKQEEEQKERSVESSEKYNYLNCLGLITKSKCMELQNRRVERKRRSTANPQFVYSMFEQPSKRKRHSYLQSGNAPHTRQTTARLNGPSPPPNRTQPIKSTSPPVTKSLIPIQKSTTRPNILRNADSKVFVNKSKVEDNQMRLPVTSAKSVQSIGNKAVHIPGLPSSLTIERIGSDSIVCISCENPGSLTVCRNCSSSYHVSCHTRPAPPSRTCPKCASAMDDEEDIEKDEEAEIKGQAEDESKLLRYKKDEKFVTTTNASGFIGKTREDSEVYKASGGLYKVDTAQKKCILPNVLGVNQLPASTFLIPIAANNISATNVNQSEDGKFTTALDTEYRQDTIHHRRVINHLARSSIACVQEDQSHAYQLPGTTVQPEKHQSYLIVQKITESTGRSNQSPGGETKDQNSSAVFNYQLPTSCSITSQNALQPIITHSLFNDHNNRKKQTNCAVPFHPITVSKLSNSLHSISSDHQLDRATLNGRKPWAKFTHGKLCVNQSARSATEILLSSCDDAENSGNEQQLPRSAGSAEKAAATATSRSRGKHRSRNFIHSLFPGHNKSHIIASRARESRGPNNRDCPLLRQQLCREEHELELHKQSDGKPAAVQLQRRALTRFFEHVKLEEAHISAPLGTKLAHKDEVDDDDNYEIAGEDSPRDEQYDDGGAVAEAPLLTSCEDLDEDQDFAEWLADDSENACDDDDNVASKDPVRRLSITLRHSEEREDDRLTTTTAAAALRIAQSNLSELRNEVSVPDDKADTERQDLPSGGRLRSRSNSNSSTISNSNSSSSSSSSSSSGHSDTPEQAMNVNDLSDNFNILAKMGFVSPGERNEELEQADDESATASEADAATG